MEQGALLTHSHIHAHTHTHTHTHTLIHTLGTMARESINNDDIYLAKKTLERIRNWLETYAEKNPWSTSLQEDEKELYYLHSKPDEKTDDGGAIMTQKLESAVRYRIHQKSLLLGLCDIYNASCAVHQQIQVKEEQTQTAVLLSLDERVDLFNQWLAQASPSVNKLVAKVFLNLTS